MYLVTFYLWCSKYFLSVWWLFPLSPAESRRGLQKGSWCREPGSAVGPLGGSTAQQPGSAGRGRPMNSDVLCLLGQEDSSSNATAVETRRRVYCLFMPGWTLSRDLWRMMKEPEHMKEIWAATIRASSVHEQHPVGCDWAHSEDTQCYDNFCFLPFLRVCIHYSSLFQRARGNLFDEEISIPNWGGHWSYVCVSECVYSMMCGCVWVHESVQGEALVPSGKFPWYFSPIVKTSTANTLCHSPADNCCLCRQEWEKAEHLMWTRHEDFVKWRTFFLFSPQCWEPQRALLFCLTSPRLIWTKKAWGSPLEVLCGYDVTLEILFVLFG